VNDAKSGPALGVSLRAFFATAQTNRPQGGLYIYTAQATFGYPVRQAWGTIPGGSIMKRSLLVATGVLALAAVSKPLFAAETETPAPIERAAPAAERAPAPAAERAPAQERRARPAQRQAQPRSRPRRRLRKARNRPGRASRGAASAAATWAAPVFLMTLADRTRALQSSNPHLLSQWSIARRSTPAGQTPEVAQAASLSVGVRSSPQLRFI